jgi:hypothetical protein
MEAVKGGTSNVRREGKFGSEGKGMNEGRQGSGAGRM